MLVDTQILVDSWGKYTKSGILKQNFKFNLKQSITPALARYSTPNNSKMTQSYSDLQLFIGKNMFLEKKAHFFGMKQSTSVLVQT